MLRCLTNACSTQTPIGNRHFRLMICLRSQKRQVFASSSAAHASTRNAAAWMLSFIIFPLTRREVEFYLTSLQTTKVKVGLYTLSSINHKIFSSTEGWRENCTL